MQELQVSVMSIRYSRICAHTDGHVNKSSICYAISRVSKYMHKPTTTIRDTMREVQYKLGMRSKAPAVLARSLFTLVFPMRFYRLSNTETVTYLFGIIGNVKMAKREAYGFVLMFGIMPFILCCFYLNV